MRREPRFESQEDRDREAETLRILLEGKDLTFEQLDKYAPCRLYLFVKLKQ